MKSASSTDRCASPDFRRVERGPGDAWLHESAPIWIVHYPGFPGSSSHRYDSWHAYKAVQKVPAGRYPWTVDNRSIGGQDGWATPEQAFRAARDEAKEMNREAA